MKHLLSTGCLSLFLLLGFAGEEIYDVPLKSIDGSNIELSSYRGKKMLILVLPGSGADGRMTIRKLSAFAASHASSLIVIGVPSTEWGYDAGKKSNLKKLYHKLPANFILAEGMKVKKGQVEQAPIFQWLTDKDKNGHNDRDVPGVGEKFFIDEKGKLYGVLGASLELDNPLIERILKRTKSTQ